jgi:hypothetical protein
MDRAYVLWLDTNGATRLTWYSYQTLGALTPFSNALDNVCNPVPTQVVVGTVQMPSLVPSANPYLSVNDSALLQFGTAVGSLVGVVAPGFREALYLADNQTVDPAQPLVIALVAAALAVPLVDSAGNAIISFVGGLRQRRGY